MTDFVDLTGAFFAFILLLPILILGCLKFLRVDVGEVDIRHLGHVTDAVRIEAKWNVPFV